MRKALLWMLVALVLVVGVSLTSGWLKKVVFIPIEVVSLKEKLQYADPALVKAAVAAEVQHGFFGMHVSLMRDRLLQVPWVIGAQVQRKWPNEVVLKVYERQPLAVWANKGVIDTEGKLFFPCRLPDVDNLPEFIGEAVHLSAMVDMYLLILARIKPIGLTVKRLTIMPDHGWQAMLDNGVTVILGQNELEERLTRFVLAFSDKKSGLQNEKFNLFDLRYINGLAVGTR